MSPYWYWVSCGWVMMAVFLVALFWAIGDHGRAGQDLGRHLGTLTETLFDRLVAA